VPLLPSSARVWQVHPVCACGRGRSVTADTHSACRRAHNSVFSGGRWAARSPDLHGAGAFGTVRRRLAKTSPSRSFRASMLGDACQISPERLTRRRPGLVPRASPPVEGRLDVSRKDVWSCQLSIVTLTSFPGLLVSSSVQLPAASNWKPRHSATPRCQWSCRPPQTLRSSALPGRCGRAATSVGPGRRPRPCSSAPLMRRPRPGHRSRIAAPSRTYVGDPLESLPGLGELEHRVVVVHVVRANGIIRCPPEVPRRHRSDRFCVHAEQVVPCAAGLATSRTSAARRPETTTRQGSPIADWARRASDGVMFRRGDQARDLVRRSPRWWWS
jgi:hypothetical protein